MHIMKSHLCPFIRLLRVPQYAKNGFVFLPLFFSGQFFCPEAFLRSMFAFLAFCFSASVVYIFNDIHDVDEDRRHPSKRNRPIASGEVSPALAVRFTGVLVCCSGIATWLTGSGKCLLVILCYLGLNAFYIFVGKQRAILDVSCVALGFVLRVMCGSFAISQDLSQWLILMVFLLCMFLALGKRWDDLCLMEEAEGEQPIRRSLLGYSKNFILSAMTLLCAINIVCYIMYTMSQSVQSHYHSPYLYLSVIWVLLGNLRYLQLAFVNQKTLSPTSILLHDRAIQIYLLCWIAFIFFLLYF